MVALIRPTSQFHTLLKHPLPTVFFIFSSVIMLSACNIGLPPPPTPGPFPDEDVRQITFDYAFYQDLSWSPNGSFITATRCPVMQYQPSCFQHEETILVDPKTDAIKKIDFQSISANHTIGYPITWSHDGTQLILMVGERNPNGDAGADEPLFNYTYFSYAINEDTFTEMDIDWIIITFSKDGSSLLVIQNIDEETLALGWYDPKTREFIEELRYQLADSFLGSFAISPDNRILLQSDSTHTSICNEVQAYIMGSHKPFEPYMSLACYPAWSPNGNKLAYTAKASSKDLPNRLIIADPDGADPYSVFIEATPHELAYPTWSPDGHQIAFTFGGLSGANGIYIVDAP
jgi:hypothetical protein